MKAVILCAGKATRMHPLTLTRPKALIPIANKPLLSHILDELKEVNDAKIAEKIDEAILVVGYKKDMIRHVFKNNHNGLKLAYVEQKEQLGTGHAFMQAKDALKNEDKFLVLNGDDLYFSEDIKKLFGYDNAALTVKVNDPEKFGVYAYDKKTRLAQQIVEKPEQFIADTANIGCYIFSKRVFDIRIEKSQRGEYEITDYVKKLIEKKDFYCIEAKRWLPIGYPWHILDANKFMIENMAAETKEGKIEGTVENNVTIKGCIFVGKNTVIKSGTYIEGPAVIGDDCVIGPNTYLRPATAIGNNCKIGFEVEIKNSVIFDNTNVPHLSYVGDSILGENVNFAAGSITANFRHDAGLIRTSINDELVSAERNKFGTVVGDNAKLGIRTIIYPGRKIWNNMATLPGEIIKEDKK